ncbi:hypothetical protein [Salana multivorans]
MQIGVGVLAGEQPVGISLGLAVPNGLATGSAVTRLSKGEISSSGLRPSGPIFTQSYADSVTKGCLLLIAPLLVLDLVLTTRRLRPSLPALAA